MYLLTFIISFVGLCVIRYSDSKQEYKRYMLFQEEEAIKENAHRNENKIKELHSQGKVFGNYDNNHLKRELEMNKWAVVYVGSWEIIKTFDCRTEAEYYVTDCFGPEWRSVEVVLIEKECK